MNKIILPITLIPLLILTACGGSDSTEPSESIVTVNAAPIIVFDDIQTVRVGEEVSITATVTDDDEVSLSWSQLLGTSVTLTEVDSESLSFIAPAVENDEVLTFSLTADDGINEPVMDSIDVYITAENASSLSRWIINNETASSYIHSATGSVLENVQVAELVNVDVDSINVEYVYVETTGIPKYDVILAQDLVDELNQRPKASTDFSAGSANIVEGQEVEFGENIGFNSSAENCLTTGGDGYWPPGPGCPTDQAVQAYFPVAPTALDDSIEACETGLGKIGLMVNGTSIFNWGDGMSQGDNLWYTLAPVAEQYDVDICGGHAARGDYHHHFYTRCLANLVGDEGSGHSPIFGFSADGYPLYGPYETDMTLAISGWEIRDYDAEVSAGGCSTEGVRSCVLVDVYDISKGVIQVSNGPDIDEEVTTLSGNILSASDGYYFEDYYYAHNTVEGTQLDEHNGHDTDDGRGYHYHITLTQTPAGKLVPAFPYTIGPRFKGELASNAISQCSSGNNGGMPPPRP
ncbi:YHYH protein [Shewanella surugensis]|uniref:YHYH protein n=1 Tax=Shewanella surugensis TaxID=212020 RepID=A0ABT0LJ33_9GAMM|nr:YHYH protein [Shewanella surugensis]MCL1127717.1 YHYH protein [Shewanella surugensis]